MKTVKETCVLVGDESCLAWINIESVLYAVEYQGIVYVTMSDGRKLEFESQVWKTLWLENR
jgi:hypothetical protein